MQSRSILLVSAIFFLSYIFMCNALASFPGEERIDRQGNDLIEGSGMEEEISVGSDIEITVQRDTIFGYFTVRKGYSLYLGGLVSLPDKVLQINLKDKGVHQSALYGSLVLIISSLILEIRKKKVRLVWR